MKKTLSILLSIVLMFALAIPVFAAEETSVTDLPANPAPNHDVTATYTPGQNVSGGTVYHVTVAWDIQSDLTYTQGNTTYTWNTDSTKYEKGEPAEDKWSGKATVTITVTNRSNAAITATPSWQAAAGIDVTCDEGTAVNVPSAATGTDLTAAEPMVQGEAKSDTITATVNTPTGGSISANNAVVGTITVNIAAN